MLNRSKSISAARSLLISRTEFFFTSTGTVKKQFFAIPVLPWINGGFCQKQWMVFGRYGKFLCVKMRPHVLHIIPISHNLREIEPTFSVSKFFGPH